MIVIGLWAIVALEIAGTVYRVSRIGKPKDAETPGSAAIGLVIAGVITVILVLAALRLSRGY